MDAVVKSTASATWKQSTSSRKPSQQNEKEDISKKRARFTAKSHSDNFGNDERDMNEGIKLPPERNENAKSEKRGKNTRNFSSAVQQTLFDLEGKRPASKPQTASSDLTRSELEILIKTSTINQKSCRETTGAVRRFQEQHERRTPRHDIQVNASKFRLMQENFKPIDGEYTQVPEKPIRNVFSAGLSKREARVPYLMYHNEHISGLFNGWQVRVSENDVKSRTRHLQYCNARLSEELTCSCHVPYGARILGVVISNARRPRTPAKLMEDIPLPHTPIENTSRTSSPKLSTIERTPRIFSRKSKSKRQSKASDQTHKQNQKTQNAIDIDSGKNDSGGDLKSSLNICRICGDHGISQNEDVSPLLAVAIKTIFVIVDATVKIQERFRQRIAYKKDCRETAAAAVIQRWFLSRQVRLKFLSILEGVYDIF